MSNPAHTIRYSSNNHGRTASPAAYSVNPNDYYDIGTLEGGGGRGGGNNNKNSSGPSSAAGCCEQGLPDACTNEVREEKLIERQQGGTDGGPDDRNWVRRVVERERNLIIAAAVLAVCLNFTEGRYILYPFMILSTWVHEMCHGMAALLMGGYIAKLEIFQDGSGLAYTGVDGDGWKRGFVASGGYPGTAVTGCLLLLFRRTTLGPTVGTICLGVCILVSCAMWVRNTWGLVTLILEGLALLLLGWKLPAHLLDALYSFLAAAVCMNAFESIQDLFAVGDYYVGGEVVTTSDAHTVADRWGMDYRFWAILWLCMSCFLTAVGIIFAFDARRFAWTRKARVAGDGIITAEVTPVPGRGRSHSSSRQPQSPAGRSAAGYYSSQSHGGTAVPSGAARPEPPSASASSGGKKKRNWLGFLKREKKYHEATVY